MDSKATLLQWQSFSYSSVTGSLILQTPSLSAMVLHFQPCSSLFPARHNSSHRLVSTRPNRDHHRILPLGRSRRLLPIAAAASPDDVDAFTKYSGYLFKDGATLEAELLNEYDLRSITAIYRRKPLLVIRRFFQIGTTFGRWFALRYIDGLLERSDQMFKIRASELRLALLELGPAFVKIAQAVSSRPDVIPPSYLNELTLLQDQIAPFSTKLAFNIMEKELDLPIDVLFSEISPEPVAAASLGQVYKGRFRSSGKLVAIKVQRPGVQAAISLDIYILRYLAGLIKKAAKLNTDFQAIIDEWAASLFREMDYREEAKNGLKFRKLYGRLQEVFVPEMYMNQSTRRVLIMEWVEGQKLTEVKDLYLVEVGVYCSLSQLLEYGFYHADPHPGNLLRTSDGKLAYLDFGMMGEFRQELRDGFIQACLHLVNRDFDSLAKDFVTLGLLPPTAQKVEVTKALTDVFENAVSKGVRNISFGDLSGNLGLTMYKFKFRIPSYFSLVIRSLAVLEGVAIGLNPNYKVLSSSYPWIARKVLTDSSPQLRSTLQTLLYKDGIFRIDLLESLFTESLRAKTNQSLARSQAENVDSAAATKQAISFALSAKGAYLRGILLQEFAKGLDALGLASLDYVTSSTSSIVPFAVQLSPVSMSDEDFINLRTLHHLALLLSRLQKHQYTNAEPVGPSLVVSSNNSVPQEGRASKVSRYANVENKAKMDKEEIFLVLYQMIYVQDFLPIISIIPELPLESQQELVRLPVDLAGMLVSRMAARTIARIFQ